MKSMSLSNPHNKSFSRHFHISCHDVQLLLLTVQEKPVHATYGATTALIEQYAQCQSCIEYKEFVGFSFESMTAEVF